VDEILIRLAEIVIPVIVTSLAVILPSMWQIRRWQAEAIKLRAEANSILEKTKTDSVSGQAEITKTLMESTGLIIGHYISAQGDMNKRLEHLEVELVAVKQERDRMQKEINVLRDALEECLKQNRK